LRIRRSRRCPGLPSLRMRRRLYCRALRLLRLLGFFVSAAALGGGNTLCAFCSWAESVFDGETEAVAEGVDGGAVRAGALAGAAWG